jgi:hypothetical protein
MNMHDQHVKRVLKGGKGVFTVRQTHVAHVFGDSCTPAGKLMFR